MSNIRDNADLESVSKKELDEAQEWMRRLRGIESVIKKREKKFERDKPRTEDRVSYRSPANIELDIRAGGGSNRAPQEATLSFWDEGYEIALLKDSFEELQRALHKSVDEAAASAPENKAVIVKKSLNSYLFSGVEASELKISRITFRKYKVLALKHAALSLRILKEAGNKVLYEYSNWP